MFISISVNDLTGNILRSTFTDVKDMQDALRFISDWVSDNVVSKFTHNNSIPYVRISDSSDGLWVDFGSHTHFIKIGGMEMCRGDGDNNHHTLQVRWKPDIGESLNMKVVCDAIKGKY